MGLIYSSFLFEAMSEEESGMRHCDVFALGWVSLLLCFGRLLWTKNKNSPLWTLEMRTDLTCPLFRCSHSFVHGLGWAGLMCVMFIKLQYLFKGRVASFHSRSKEIGQQAKKKRWRAKWKLLCSWTNTSRSFVIWVLLRVPSFFCSMEYPSVHWLHLHQCQIWTNNRSPSFSQKERRKEVCPSDCIVQLGGVILFVLLCKWSKE